MALRDSSERPSSLPRLADSLGNYTRPEEACSYKWVYYFTNIQDLLEPISLYRLHQ